MSVHTLDPVQERLDQVSAQLADLAAAMAAERAERERWRELVHELVPVAQGAMQVASDELADLSQDVTVDDALRFARTAARTLPQLEAMLTLLASAGDLAHEVTSLSGAGLATVSDALARAEQRGYFEAARRGGVTLEAMVAVVNTGPPAEPPSTLALLRRLRDPQVRRGLAVALALVSTLGAQTTNPTLTKE